LDRSDTVGLEFLEGLWPHALQLGERGDRSGERGHLLLNFLALLLFALNVNAPPDQLAGQADILAFLADGERELGILDDDLEAFLLRIHQLDARDLGRRERLLGK